MCIGQHFIDSSTESAVRSAIRSGALALSHVLVICHDPGRVTTRTNPYQKILVGHSRQLPEDFVTLREAR